MRRAPARALRAVVVLTAGSLVSCTEPLPMRGHLRLHIDTDAPLPSGKNAPADAFIPAPLFDTLRVELYPTGEETPCAGCTREFELTQERVAEGATFTVLQESGSRARVLLFRSRDAASGLPNMRLESWTALPRPPDTGAIDVTIAMRVDRLGTPQGSASEPLEPALGLATPLAPWSLATRRDCTHPARAGAVCVPGGAFVMGDAALRGFGDYDSDIRKVVVLSPFFLDASEVTVGEYRRGDGPIGPKDYLPWSGSLAGASLQDWCTYTERPGPHEDYPMNCVVHAAARAFCIGRGGDLPTEAQLEYVEGGLASQRYPWGMDRPECNDAVWGLGGFQGSPTTAPFANSCRPSTGTDEQVMGYVKPVTSQEQRKRDFVDVRGARIVDVAGSLAEWARDAFAPQTSVCWSRSILIDPICEIGEERVMRGGSWLVLSAAAGRSSLLPNSANTIVGLRCAYPAD